MRRRKRRFRNSWIAIRASPGGASTRCASPGMVSGRGSHRPKEHSDPGVAANRQPADSAKGSRLRLGLFVWRGLPVAGQSGGADHADLQYRRHEPSSQRDQQPSRLRCPCRGDPRSRWMAPEPGTPGARQHHVIGAAALQPRTQSGRAVWHYLRSHWLANSVFCSLADIMDACEMAWNRFATDHGLIRSLCAVAWAPASPAL
jgi:hypothetical protein